MGALGKNICTNEEIFIAEYRNIWVVKYNKVIKSLFFSILTVYNQFCVIQSPTSFLLYLITRNTFKKVGGNFFHKIYIFSDSCIDYNRFK